MAQYDLAIDLAAATVSDGKFTFKYDVYASLSVATLTIVNNMDTIKSAPCVVRRRPSGTFVLQFENTPLYVSAADPMSIQQADPD